MKRAVLLKELRNSDMKTLFSQLAEANKKIAKLQFSAKFRELKNFHEITFERKKIALIWTILSEKAIESAKEQAKKEQPKVKNDK